MKISGISMGKNVGKLYYPVKESVMSILPLVDEFVFALGDCDNDDNTRRELESIDSPKLKIVDTVWDIEKYPRGMEHAHQTDIAKEHCTGDWIFYIQNDEVIHEKYFPVIREKCEKYLSDKSVDGFLFGYKHFWGDYNHYHNSHGWYKHEMRIVRNEPDIHSWESAQSFRRIPNFDGVFYRQQEGTYKLNVVKADAEVYHYGWVRPPAYMKSKILAFDTNHKGEKRAHSEYKFGQFDYGPLNRLAVFNDTHPAVMKNWIAKFNWKDDLQYSGKVPTHRKKFKHEKLKYRVVTWIENNILGGRELGGWKNWHLLNK